MEALEWREKMAKLMTLDGLRYLWSQLKEKLDTKVNIESGKGLSSNDFTNDYKNKLKGIAAGANNYIHPDSGVAAGTYQSVSVDEQGHVIGGINPTTLQGYGITDAAEKVHTHTKSQIADFPETLKNPAALTIQVEGAVVASYDGSAGKTVNLSAAELGLEEITEEDIDNLLSS